MCPIRGYRLCVKAEEALNFQGLCSVLPTPFSNNGDIDFVSLRKVADLYIRAGVNDLMAYHFRAA